MSGLRAPVFHVPSALPQACLSKVTPAEKTLEVEARVTGVFPARRQARALDTAGFEYALTRATPGMDVGALHEGQRLRCVVETDLRRVLHAQALA